MRADNAVERADAADMIAGFADRGMAASRREGW
jgi:hypothetical protein